MKTLSGIALLIILVVATNLQAEPFCGELDADFFGPFDYTNTYDRRNLQLAEGGRFTSNIRNLVSGNEGSLASELAYTLRAFPNHYPALIALAKLSLRRDRSVDYPRDQLYSAECFFDRAMRFRPSDVTVRTIYGNYLHSLDGRQDDAMEQYQVAASS